MTARQQEPTSPAARDLPSLALGKLAPPAVRGDAVVRARLLEKLQSSNRAKLVLIQAPAGYGKTTLMAQWSKHLQDGDERVGWITLDDKANDPATLLASLIVALLREQPAATPDLLAVINRCATENPRYTLFLDEVESLRDPASLRLLEMLLDYSPANLHVVMGTRASPQLPLARLRVRNDVVDLSSRDLQFLRGEAAQFLYVRSGAQLRKATLDALLEKTEGWAAALQLIAMALARGGERQDIVEHLSGSSAQIVEYLAVDVVDKLPEDTRRFLLETSVLKRLSAPLCEAVTGHPDCAAMLMKLEIDNLFVQVLDGLHHWYRYHALFASFLQQRLDRTHPGRAQEIARKAAAWCAANGLPGEAVDYSLQAKDTAGAIAHMRACLDHQIQFAQFRTILNWLSALPKEEIARHPPLVIANAWAMNFCQEYRRAGESIQQLRQLSEAADTASIFRTALLALEPVMLARTGQLDKMMERAQVALDEVGREYPRERSMIANQFAYGHITAGRHDEAKKWLREAMACHAQARPANVFGLAYTIGHEAIDDACLGDLEGAIRKYQSIEKIVLEHTGVVTPFLEQGYLPASTIGLCADLLYERNEIDEAEAWLDRFYRFLDSIPPIETIMLAYLTRARIQHGRGDVQDAEDTLTAAEHHLTRTGIQRDITVFAWERVRMALLAGDVGKARLMADAVRMPSETLGTPGHISPSEESTGAGIGTMRLLVHEGRCDEASKWLRIHIEHSSRTLRRRRLAKLHVIEALALDKVGQAAEAQKVLGTAIRLGATMGAVRCFVDEGPVLRPLLDKLTDDVALALDKKALTHLQAVLAAFGAADPAPTEVPSQQIQSLIEGLSAREVQILQRLSQGYSNLAVAQQLFVSTNTVKWHLRQIYEKLGATNRSQAIFLARRHGLLT